MQYNIYSVFFKGLYGAEPVSIAGERGGKHAEERVASIKHSA